MAPGLFEMRRDSENAKQPISSTGAAAALVYAHAGVFIVHGVAHSQLHVELSTWAKVFVAAVIGIAPILAVVLLKSGSRLKGAGTLAIAMAASLLFGIWNHFFVHAADHVADIPGGPWRLPFQVTAGLLVTTEVMGFVLALRLVRSQHLR
jgi:hypothetical protein